MPNNLNKIDHIVVLMLENRSFDQMLGYLKLEGKREEIDGLCGDEENRYNDKSYKVFKFSTSERKFIGDPAHDWEAVKEQLSNNNGGFVKSFSAISNQFPEETLKNPGRVMGYYNGEDLPTYDFLAKEFCVCNRWFASVPGPTQPNRVYAFSGNSDGHKENIFSIYPLRLFQAKTVFHHLDAAKISWKFFSHDIASLRYNVHYTKPGQKNIDKYSKFVELARKGKLHSVS